MGGWTQCNLPTPQVISWELHYFGCLKGRLHRCVPCTLKMHTGLIHPPFPIHTLLLGAQL